MTQTTRLTPIMLGVFLCCSACGDDTASSTAAQTPAVDETAAADPEPTERPEPEPSADPNPSEPRTLDAADRRTIREARREGRRATRIGEVTSAIGHFDRALALRSNDASLHCEAGFAATQSDSPEHREYARRHLRIGVALFGHPPAGPQRERLAMCLFNRGVLAQREHDWTTAVEVFERSLALRENATVRTQLEAARTGRIPPSQLLAADSLEALEAVWQAELDGHAFGPRVEVDLDRTLPAEGGRGEIGVFSLTEESDVEWGYETRTTLALRTQGGYHRLTIDRTTVPPCCDQGGGAELTAAVSVGEGLVRLDVTSSSSFGHEDEIETPEGLERETWCQCGGTSEESWVTVHLCRVGSELRCRALSLGRRTSSDSYVRCVELDDEERERELRPGPEWATAACSARQGEAQDEGYRLEAETDPQRGIRLTLGEGELDGETPLPLDRWVPFEQVLSGDD